MTELAVQHIEAGDQRLSEDGEQFLTFIMAGEEYGVDILCVQEIRGWEQATPIPNAPPHIKGVINLRGAIVPIVDLRLCFGMSAIEYNELTVVIVLKVESATTSRTMGVVVDAVSDVYSIVSKQVKPAPDLGDAVNTSYIRGLVNIEEKMVVLLEIDKLLNIEDLLATEHGRIVDPAVLQQCMTTNGEG